MVPRTRLRVAPLEKAKNDGCWVIEHVYYSFAFLTTGSIMYR